MCIDGYCVAANACCAASSRQREPASRGDGVPAARADPGCHGAAVAERGYAGASVEEIRRRAGVSRRTFYAHFGGKEDAVVAAFDAAVAYVLPRLVEAFRSAPDWAGAIDATVAAYLALAECDGAWAALCVVELPGAGRRAMARRDAALERLAEELGPSADLHGIIAALDGQMRTRLVRRWAERGCGVLAGGGGAGGCGGGRPARADWTAVRAALARAVARGDGPVLLRTPGRARCVPPRGRARASGGPRAADPRRAAARLVLRPAAWTPSRAASPALGRCRLPRCSACARFAKHPARPPPRSAPPSASPTSPPSPASSTAWPQRACWSAANAAASVAPLALHRGGRRARQPPRLRSL